MATELNFTARLDTSQFLSQVDQARTHFGLAFGGQSQIDYSGGIAGQMQAMMAGLQNSGGPGSGFGHSFSPLYNMSYGASTGETTIGQEWAVHRGGVPAAMPLKPPGVSGADYALAVEKNYINRQLEASHAANMAAQGSFFSGVGGLAGGEIASAAAAPIGAFVGGRLASRFFGAGAAGAGRMVGGLAASWIAFDKASEYFSEKIEDHFAKIEQISGVTTELGELAGAGRGLKRSQRLELGIAARGAAQDIGMDFQEMGDILALGRQAGMLPNATDPGKAREQYREFARAIEEGAQILGTSLAGATQVIRQASAHGMGAQEAIVRAAAAGGPEAFMNQLGGFSIGASMGRAMGFTGAQGIGVYGGAMAGVGMAGMTGEEMQILGGRGAAAQFVAQTQMAMAKSPLGNLQMMAAMGGGNMAGMSMMDLPGAALGGLTAGGGDFMSNAGRFLVHQNEYRRGIGSGGIQTLSRSQLQMGGEMISMFMPDLSANEAQRLYAQSMGLDPDQAKLLVGAQGGRGGGIGGLDAAGRMRAYEALQSSLVGTPGAGDVSGPRAFGAGYALEGGMAGLTFGPKGAIIGAAAGFVIGNVGAMADALEGPGLFASATEKADYWSRKQAQAYDESITNAEKRFGYIRFNKEAGERFLTGNMGGARLDLDAVGSPLASARTAATMRAMGLSPVKAGAGTIRVDGEYWSAREYQRIANGAAWAPQLTEEDRMRTIRAAVAATHGEGQDPADVRERVRNFMMNYETVRLGATPGGSKEMPEVSMSDLGINPFSAKEKIHGSTQDRYQRWLINRQSDEDFGVDQIDARSAGLDLINSARRIVEMTPATGEHAAVRARVLARLEKPGAIYDREVRSFLEGATGRSLKELNPAAAAGRAGAAGLEEAERASDAREANFLRGAYGMGGHLNPMLQEVVTRYRDSGNTHLVMQADAVEVLGAKRLPSSYYKELQRNEHFINFKEHALAGRMTEAKKELQIAETVTLSEGKDKYLGMSAPHIDPEKKVVRPEAQAFVKTWDAGVRQKEDLAAAWRTMGAIPGFESVAAAAAGKEAEIRDQKSKEVVDAMNKMLEPTSLVDEVKKQHGELGTKPSQRARTRPRGPGTVERAIGFGEQESAMASILQSLRSTERSIVALEKKIAGPSASPQSGSPTGGK